MGEKLGKVQALVVEFSADCAAIRAKSRAGGYSEAVDSWGTGVYASYTHTRRDRGKGRLFVLYSTAERDR